MTRPLARFWRSPTSFEPLVINALTPLGFGGRVYFPTAVGKGFCVLQVMPKPGEGS